MYLENNEIKQYPVKIAIAWILVVMWMAVIFAFSHQSGEASSSVSRELATVLLRLTGTTGDSALLSAVEVVLRKIAHGFIFFVLGLLVSYAFETVRIKEFANAGLTLAVCMLYAVSDELHQEFVPGRVGTLTDFLIDTLGIVIAIVLYQVIRTVLELRAELMVQRQEDLRL